uniref:Uncharacterized protein n=1 Tax=Ascaris lumbricoides TaxID=6252 RepID=A0A0M3I997_ASCLU
MQMESIVSTAFDERLEILSTTDVDRFASYNSALYYIDSAKAQLYILMTIAAAILLSCFILIFYIVIREKVRKRRSKEAVYILDAPPRYSDVMPPPYEWVMAHQKIDEKRLLALQIESFANSTPA